MIMKWNNVKSGLAFSLMLVLSVLSSWAVEPWGYWHGDAGNLRFYPTQKPSHPSDDSPLIHSLSLDHSIYPIILTGDVMGNGRTYLVYGYSDQDIVGVLDPLTGEIVTINLDPNPYSPPSHAGKAVTLTHLLDFDNEPGLELLCYSGWENARPSMQIVSFKQKKVLRSFSGEAGADANGDGWWSGYEVPNYLFKDTTDQWKILTSARSGRPDLIPREIRVYDVESGTVESRFTIAASPAGNSLWQPEGQNPWFFFAPMTPDNSEPPPAPKVMLGDSLTSDAESYVLGFQYDPALASEQKSLTLNWFDFRAKFVSGGSLIAEDIQQRILSVAWDHIIREFDPISPGKLHVYELQSGNELREFSVEEGYSFGFYPMMANQTDKLFIPILEEARFQVYDINTGLLSEADYSTDPTAQLISLGLTDMDGDGEYDVLVKKESSKGAEVLIFDQNLNEKAAIPLSLGSYNAFADADNDGYPELYIVNSLTNRDIMVIEYQASASASGRADALK
jgi:hypothetical protein